MEMKTIKELEAGCGDEYLDDSGEWELMCGKHIWETKDKIKELRLCPKCQAEHKALKDVSGLINERIKELELELLSNTSPEVLAQVSILRELKSKIKGK